MFKEILQLILNGTITSKKQIAEALSVQPETLEDMLRILIEKGMLTQSECKPIDQAKCSSCPIAGSSCNDTSLGQVYYVTERGKKYAAK